ncbi:MAG: DUF362 domain-containing protein [Planctomycetota bacterium]
MPAPSTGPACIPFTDYASSVPAAMDAIGAAAALADRELVLIKPNLVEAAPHPVTTPAACVEALIGWIRTHADPRIVIGEGTGAADYDTQHCFDELGYTALAARSDVELLDLNHAPCVEHRRDDCSFLPTCHLPQIAFEALLISVPVLKAHSLAMVTGSLKNMMGLAPPLYYQQGGHWKKSAFHREMHRAIIELNRYRSPDLSLIDASIGLSEYHLGGPTCEPPVQRLIAGFDTLAVDRAAAEALGIDWRSVPHLAD